VRLYGEDLRWERAHGKKKMRVKKNMSRLGDLVAQINRVEGYESSWDQGLGRVKKCLI